MQPPGGLSLLFDIGNTDVYGGLYAGEELILEFRKSNRYRPSADEFGVFLVQLFQARGIDPRKIEQAAIACVVPDALKSVAGACRKFLGIEPLVLQTGVRTGLKIKVKDPREVGADRIANAIAAVDLYPGKHLIVIDMGTATTFCAINANREYLGGAIAAGLSLSMNALGTQTAKLPVVDIIEPEAALGRTTVHNIQSGLYYGHIGLVRELVSRLTDEAFDGAPALVIGTGGHAQIFLKAGIFDAYHPALVLRGLLRALDLNAPVPS